MVMHQVTDDMPTYKVQDNDRNVKIIHHNQLFLVATPKADAMPLRRSELASEEGAT